MNLPFISVKFTVPNRPTSDLLALVSNEWSATRGWGFRDTPRSMNLVFLFNGHGAKIESTCARYGYFAPHKFSGSSKALAWLVRRKTLWVSQMISPWCCGVPAALQFVHTPAWGSLLRWAHQCMELSQDNPDSLVFHCAQLQGFTTEGPAVKAWRNRCGFFPQINVGWIVDGEENSSARETTEKTRKNRQDNWAAWLQKSSQTKTSKLLFAGEKWAARRSDELKAFPGLCSC